MSTAKVDIEVVLERIKSIFVANLNTKITEINTQKNDGRTLASVGANAYNLLGLNTNLMNQNPFVLFWVELGDAITNGPYVAQQITVDVVLVLADSGDDSHIYRSLLRYMKALKEVAQDNWQDADLPGKMTIQSLEPLPVYDWNGSELGKGTGVRIKTTLS